jgi:hypothetical protein
MGQACLFLRDALHKANKARRKQPPIIPPDSQATRRLTHGLTPRWVFHQTHQGCGKPRRITRRYGNAATAFSQ